MHIRSLAASLVWLQLVLAKWRGPLTGTLPKLMDDTVREYSTLAMAKCICEHK